MQEETYYEEGSYTVEAAFIVPMVLGIVFVIMYLIMLFHDQVILQGNITNEVMMVYQQKEVEQSNIYQKRLVNNLWIVKIKEAKIKKNLLDIKGNAIADVKWKIPVLSLFMKEKQQIKVEESFLNYQPDEIRRIVNKKSAENKNSENSKIENDEEKICKN